MTKTLLGQMIILSVLLIRKTEYLGRNLKDGRPNSVYENLQTIAWDSTEAKCSSKKNLL